MTDFDERLADAISRWHSHLCFSHTQERDGRLLAQLAKVLNNEEQSQAILNRAHQLQQQDRDLLTKHNLLDLRTPAEIDPLKQLLDHQRQSRAWSPWKHALLEDLHSSERDQETCVLLRRLQENRPEIAADVTEAMVESFLREEGYIKE